MTHKHNFHWKKHMRRQREKNVVSQITQYSECKKVLLPFFLHRKPTPIRFSLSAWKFWGCGGSETIWVGWWKKRLFANGACLDLSWQYFNGGLSMSLSLSSTSGSSRFLFVISLPNSYNNYSHFFMVSSSPLVCSKFLHNYVFFFWSFYLRWGLETHSSTQIEN